TFRRSAAAEVVLQAEAEHARLIDVPAFDAIGRQGPARRIVEACLVGGVGHEEGKVEVRSCDRSPIGVEIYKVRGRQQIVIRRGGGGDSPVGVGVCKGPAEGYLADALVE